MIYRVFEFVLKCETPQVRRKTQQRLTLSDAWIDMAKVDRSYIPQFYARIWQVGKLTVSLSPPIDDEGLVFGVSHYCTVKVNMLEKAEVEIVKFEWSLLFLRYFCRLLLPYHVCVIAALRFYTDLCWPIWCWNKSMKSVPLLFLDRSNDPNQDVWNALQRGTQQRWTRPLQQRNSTADCRGMKHWKEAMHSTLHEEASLPNLAQDPPCPGEALTQSLPVLLVCVDLLVPVINPVSQPFILIKEYGNLHARKHSLLGRSVFMAEK